METGGNRNLVISRVGSNHALAELIRSNSAKRNWDLAISVYDEKLILDSSVDLDWFHQFGGGKWDGIYEFFLAFPHVLESYDYFWLVDDDIETTPGDVNRLFEYVADYDLEIAQPALTPDSFCSYQLTLQCPVFSHRQTNFVELMLPVLTRDVLKSVLPLCQGSWSGKGIDWMWYRFARDARRGVAIIDAVAMGHRRPLKTLLRGRMLENQICHEEERRRILGDSVGRYVPIAFSGQLVADSRVISNRWGTMVRMFSCYWEQRRLFIAENSRWKRWFIFAWQQIFSPLRFDTR